MEKQTSDHVFDLFFENSIDLLCIADKSGNFVKLNNAWTDTLGYQLTELEGRPYIGFVHPDDVESTIQATRQLANNQKVQHFINRYRHKDGTYRWIEWLSYPSEDTVYASAHDITDRIEAEQALKESESKYRKIVEDLPLALCVADMEGNIKYINNTFLKYFEYELAEIPTIERWALLAFAGDDNNKTSAVFWQQSIEEITKTKTPNILPKIYSVRTKSGKNIETEITLVLIGNELYIFFNDVTEKQKVEEALQKRVLALTKPLDDTEGIKFTDLFNIEELQKVQDTFSDATGVASIITHTDGTPITRPSNFCNLCNLIRGTEKGRANCFKSDKIIGKQNIDGPIVQPCYSGGLWDAGAGITLGGKHFANWLIGQVRNEVQDESEMLKYADKIGVDREQFRQALKEVPMMSKERFEKVSQSLFVLANQLSLKAYQNVQQARFIAEQKKAEKELADAKALLDTALMQTPIPMVVISAPDYVVQLSNSACKEILGIGDGFDYNGKSLFDWPPTWQDFEESGSQIPLSDSPLSLAMNGIETKNKEYFIKRKDGSIRWASVSASPIRNSQGDVIAAYLVFPDITERKINEEEIQKQAKLHQTILDTITVGLTFVKNRKQEWVNQSHCRIFGYEHEEMIGLETSVFYANVKDYEWIGAEGYNKLANGEVYFVEIPMKKKDGSIIWCSIAGKALDHKDISKGSIWMLQDIDDRKKTEEKFKRLASLNQTILDTVSVGLTLVRKLRHVWVNSSFCKILGYDLDELIDSPMLMNYSNKEDFEKVSTEGHLHLSMGEVYTTEVKNKRKDGNIIWISLSGKALNPQDIDEGILWMVQDITEQKYNETKLHEKEAELLSIFKTAPVGIGLTKNRVFQECNDTFYDMTGYSPEEIIGQNTRKIYANEEEYLSIDQKQIRQMEKQYTETVETLWLHKDGAIINILLSFVPIDTQDFSKGVTFSALDISDRKKTELEIKKLNSELEDRVLERTEQLQQANKDLESFAYSISHDLRAPLRHIDGFVNLLYSNIPEPLDNVTNYYKKINAATKRLSVMIEELLAFSRLGRKEISYSKVNLQLLVSNVIENLKPEFAHRKIKWIIGDLPVVYGDLSLLQFAFENIISNSIKYTGKKELAIIELGTLSKKENKTGLFTVFIKDNGAGFDMKYADKLFGVFQRLHTNEDFEGVGIGLANVKQIVTKHKGTISAESEVDKGATFYITLPEPSENL